MLATRKIYLKNFSKKISSFLLLLFLFFLLINYSLDSAVAADSGWLNTVNQGGLNKVGETYGQTNTQSSNSLVMMIARIIKVFLGLLGIIFLVLLIFAGFKWMTSGGNQDKVSDAKAQITTAVIGLAIILASYAISHLVFNKLIFATTGSEPVW